MALLFIVMGSYSTVEHHLGRMVIHRNAACRNAAYRDAAFGILSPSIYGIIT